MTYTILGHDDERRTLVQNLRTTAVVYRLIPEKVIPGKALTAS